MGEKKQKPVVNSPPATLYQVFKSELKPNHEEFSLITEMSCKMCLFANLRTKKVRKPKRIPQNYYELFSFY